jgi:ArsR family transcriptional regulator
LTSIIICIYVHVVMARAGVASLQIRPAARLFKALGDDTRLRIVALLSHGELCVCHVQDALGLSQPNASRQLAVLRNAGVVESRRDGTWTHYKLARQVDGLSERQLTALVRSFSRHAVLNKDVERLIKVRGPAACE